MKSLSQFSFLLATFCLLLNFQALAQERRNQNLMGFTALKASSGVNVYLSQGSSESVEIEADEEAFRYIVAEIEDGNVLVLRMENTSKRWFKNIGPVNVYVSFTELDNIQLSGGSDVFGQGKLEFAKLRISSSGGADLRMQLQADELEVSSSGGSDVELSGTVAYFNGTASGGSDIKARELEAVVAEVSASGAADVHVRATRELKATASGASDIVYYGNPEKVELKESGASDITRR